MSQTEAVRSRNTAIVWTLGSAVVLCTFVVMGIAIANKKTPEQNLVLARHNANVIYATGYSDEALEGMAMQISAAADIPLAEARGMEIKLMENHVPPGKWVKTVMLAKVKLQQDN